MRLAKRDGRPDVLGETCVRKSEHLEGRLVEVLAEAIGDLQSRSGATIPSFRIEPICPADPVAAEREFLCRQQWAVRILSSRSRTKCQPVAKLVVQLESECSLGELPACIRPRRKRIARASHASKTQAIGQGQLALESRPAFPCQFDSDPSDAEPIAKAASVGLSPDGAPVRQRQLSGHGQRPTAKEWIAQLC